MGGVYVLVREESVLVGLKPSGWSFLCCLKGEIFFIEHLQSDPSLGANNLPLSPCRRGRSSTDLLDPVIIIWLYQMEALQLFSLPTRRNQDSLAGPYKGGRQTAWLPAKRGILKNSSLPKRISLFFLGSLGSFSELATSVLWEGRVAATLLVKHAHNACCIFHSHPCCIYHYIKASYLCPEYSLFWFGGVTISPGFPLDPNKSWRRRITRNSLA